MNPELTVTTLTAPSASSRLLLTVNEVAAELGCGRDTVYSLLTTGALPSVRLGARLRRIRRSDLDNYINSLSTTWPAA